MIILLAISFFIILIRWELVIIFLFLNFFVLLFSLRGNQTLIFDKSIPRNFLIFLSLLIIILIKQSSVFYYNIKNRLKSYRLNLILITIILLLCFYSINFFSFYFFFELVVIPTFFIILGWGYSSERIQAGAYLFLYTLIASLPFLIFVINFFKVNNSIIFDFIAFQKLPLNKFIWVFISLVFIVKIPIFLLHIWLPKAHVEAPVSGSIILAGILLKLGRYGFIKSFYIEKIKFIQNETILYSIRFIGTLIISLNCLRQKDLKMLIAYSSVRHINIIIIAILSLTWFGLKRSFIIIIAHGLRSSSIFFILNIFYNSVKSRRIILIKNLLLTSSILAIWWIILCCLNISCPPSINFVSEIIIAISIISYNYFIVILFMIILIIRGIYSILLFVRPNHGKIIIIFSNKESSLNNSLTLISHSFYSFSLLIILFFI